MCHHMHAAQSTIPFKYSDFPQLEGFESWIHQILSKQP